MKKHTRRELTGDAGVVSVQQEWLLPKRLRRGIRELLDGGRLRIDPEEAAKLIGAAMDLEIERLSRIRQRRGRRGTSPQAQLQKVAEDFFRTAGHAQKPTPAQRPNNVVEWEKS
jgi:hypothetical protein